MQHHSNPDSSIVKIEVDILVGNINICGREVRRIYDNLLTYFLLLTMILYTKNQKSIASEIIYIVLDGIWYMVYGI